MDKIVFVIKDGGIVAIYPSTEKTATEMNKKTGLSFDRSDIAHVCRKSGKHDSLHGYTFRYVETLENHLWGFVGPQTQKRDLF